MKTLVVEGQLYAHLGDAPQVSARKDVLSPCCEAVPRGMLVEDWTTAEFIDPDTIFDTARDAEAVEEYLAGGDAVSFQMGDDDRQDLMFDPVTSPDSGADILVCSSCFKFYTTPLFVNVEWVG